MKKVITIISAAVLGISAATAQTILQEGPVLKAGINNGLQDSAVKAVDGHAEWGNITINDAGIDRNDGLISVNMDLDLSKFDVNTNRAVLLTPYIVNGEESQVLPSLGFYGRNRYYYYVRNDGRMCEGSAETSYKSGDEPEYLPYFVNVPYEDWMRGAELMLEKKVYGCCGNVLDTEYCSLAEYYVYQPHFLYIRPPKKEQPKTRSLEGNAFVDYPVSETVIYPDYHNNRVELGKIRATIDSVRLDRDVTVKSLFIKGFASPESPYSNNTRLAKGRTEAIRQYVLGLCEIPAEVITTDYEPENWEGLREYVQEWPIPNKEAIIALIDSDEEPDRKEWLIKSRYQKEYKYLLETCYPYLRRTYYRIDYDIRSFTEVDAAHVRELAKTRPQMLSLDEFYIAAHDLDPASEEFRQLFDVAVRMFPDDPVANLNAANVAMQKGDLETAAKYLDKAGQLPETLYARGVLAALHEDYKTAAVWFKTALAEGVSAAEDELAKVLR